MVPQNIHHNANSFIMILHCTDEKKEKRMIRRENRGRYYPPPFSYALPKSLIFPSTFSQQ